MTSDPGAERPVRVIVAGDDGEEAGWLRDLLAWRGFQVAGPSWDLAEAIDVASSLGVDVVVVNLGDPELDGLRALDGRRLPWRLVVVAGREDEDLLLAAVQAGATGFVVRAGHDREGAFAFGDELAAAVVGVHRGESVVPNRMLGGLLVDLIHWSHQRDLAVKEADRLSGRQRAVLLLLGSGASLGTIAEALDVSVYTVRSHVHELLRKLGVHSRSEAVLWAARNGVLDQLRREAEPVQAVGGGR
jgi:DNA-binding NarL/FixJ family response regulator